MDRVSLPPKFVIPGGTTLSAQLDVARATIRRGERRVVALHEAGELASEAILGFLNRASDAAYAMARFADLPEPELFAGRDAGADGRRRRPGPADGASPAAGRGTPTTSRSREAHRVVFDERRRPAAAPTSAPPPPACSPPRSPACTAITVEMYAGRKEWDLGQLEVEVEMDYDERGTPTASR